MHFARNCLSHGAGYVRNRDCNTDDNTLKVTWLAFVMKIKDGENEIQIEDAIKDNHIVQSPEGAKVFLEYCARSKTVEVGKKLSFSEPEICEIAHFYVTRAHQITEGFIDFAKERGVPFNSPVQE